MFNNWRLFKCIQPTNSPSLLTNPTCASIHFATHKKSSSFLWRISLSAQFTWWFAFFRELLATRNFIQSPTNALANYNHRGLSRSINRFAHGGTATMWMSSAKEKKTIQIFPFTEFCIRACNLFISFGSTASSSFPLVIRSSLFRAECGVINEIECNNAKKLISLSAFVFANHISPRSKESHLHSEEYNSNDTVATFLSTLVNNWNTQLLINVVNNTWAAPAAS